MSQENLEIVYEWLRVFDESKEFAWHLLAPDPELINPPGAPFTNAAGLEGFQVWLAEANDAFEEWSNDIEKVIDAGHDEVLTLGRISGRGRGTGLRVEMELHTLYTLVDGKIGRVQGYFSRQEALQAAGLSE